MSAARLFEIRIPQHLIRPLREAVVPRRGGERVAFGLASHAQTPDRDLLLVTRIVALADGDYVPTVSHGAQWRGRAMLSLMNEAIASNLGIVIFHAHSHPGPVDLSSDDRGSAGRLLPVFENVVSARPHASVVLGEECAAGIVVDRLGLQTFERVRVRWLGKTILDCEDVPRPFRGTADEIYKTQALLTGGAGEATLRRSKVAVVGLSGGGSHVVQQLAHFAVGEILGIDADRAEPSQRSRLIGLP